MAQERVFEIQLTQGKIALIDAKDLLLVNDITWYAAKSGNCWYVQGNEKQKDGSYRHVKMHRRIMRAPKGKLVDHVNHDGLDNRRKNLRFAVGGRNNYNTRSHHGTSKYKGVHRNSADSKWVASIRKNNRLKTLGSFEDEVDAALAYDRAAVRLFGKFAAPNFPRRILELIAK